MKVTPAGEAAAAALAVPPREAIPEHWLDVIDESIRHRGPDGQGRFRDRVVRADGSVVDVALVHRRLSIIDHTGGAQPMVSVLGTPPLRGEPVRSPARGVMPPLLFHGKPSAPVVYHELRGTGILRVNSSSSTGILPVGSSGSTGILPVHSPGHGRDARAPDLVAVVFNGCIYNHRDLRRELRAAGHEFATDHSDTEVLLHGWREWGESLFERLDGMFALAIWDRVTGTCIWARDRAGEKPFYSLHTRSAGAWINALSSVPIDATRLASLIGINEDPFTQGTSVREWLRFGFGLHPPTPLARSLFPGSAVLYGPLRSERWSRRVLRTADGDPGVTNFGSPTSIGRDGRISRPTRLDAETVDSLIATAVHSRLEADVQLGCFLSGGVDSSLIALHARRAAGSLKTFAVRMPGIGFDESEFAAAAAKIAGSDHATLDCAPTPATDLVALVRQMGLPFGDSSLLAAAWVSRAAKQYVGVAISGDGGDELFAGYERYVWANTSRAWIPGARALGTLLERGADPRSRRGKAARLLLAAAGDGYRDLLAVFRRDQIDRLILSAPPAAGDDDPLLGPTINSTAWAIEFDLQRYLPNDLLRKTDSASMSCALEVRCPMLHWEVVRAGMYASLDSLMPRGRRKGLLRQVARKYFPARIVDRPKQGFAIPVGEWFRSDYGGMKQLLMDHLESAEPWGPPRLGIELNMKFVRQMVDEHMNERRDHSQRLYMLLVLSIWAKWMGTLGG